MEAQAHALGLGSITMLPMRTLDDFHQLPERIESDETGVAERVGSQLSPRHKHLFLLAMHVGAEWARVRGSEGELLAPDRDRIGRHATLAGIPPGLWEPLATRPSSSGGELVMADYRKAIDTLEMRLCCINGGQTESGPLRSAD